MNVKFFYLKFYNNVKNLKYPLNVQHIKNKPKKINNEFITGVW